MAVSIDLKGKRGVIWGVANQRSIAWAISERLAEAGAELPAQSRAGCRWHCRQKHPDTAEYPVGTRRCAAIGIRVILRNAHVVHS